MKKVVKLEEKEENKIKKKQKVIEIDKTDDVIFNIIVFVCIMMMAFAITPKTLQNDTFYTISCGEYLVENGIFGAKLDPFSWHDLAYTFPHWLYDIAVYFIYALCGRFWELGIYLSTMILTAILGISVYKLSLQLSKNNRVVSFIVTLFAMYLMKPYIAARAQLVTFILFVLEVYFIEKLLETNKKIYAIPLLLIPLLITELHCAVYIMYFVFALPYLVEYLFVLLTELDLDEKLFIGVFKILSKITKNEDKKIKFESLIDKSRKNIESRKIKREKKKKNPYKVIAAKNPAILTLVVIIIIAAFIGLLNPMGTGAYTYTFKIYEGNTTDSINEHLPLTLADNINVAVVLAIILSILVLIDIKVRLSDLFMIAGTMILMFTARRQVSLFLIMCMPILARLISGFFEKYDKKFCNVLIKFTTSIVGTVIVVGLVGYISYDLSLEKKGNEYISTSSYPVAATEWLLNYMVENDIAPEDLHIYNEYNFGSYLLFKGIPPFIDSRCDLYTPEFNGDEDKDIFSDALSVTGANNNYQNIFEKYGVRYVMIYDSTNLNVVLKDDPDYQLLHEDGDFCIYKYLKAEI